MRARAASLSGHRKGRTREVTGRRICGSFGPMLIPVLLQVAALGTPFSGTQGPTAVPIARLSESGIVVDGDLSETVWAQAARLTGFGEYAPVDGRPAEDSTEVLVWYSPTAIWFGVRAREPHGAVHASLANRDRISTDDWIEILLDTFDDHRQAVVFGVNPLGVQSDGTLNETQAGSRDTVDHAADFVYQSHGRLTPEGFEVEIRIPFKSLRYQPRDTVQWSLNVRRAVQHSGHQQTWPAARLAAASFLAQSGSLTGLTGLHRDLVLDLNPEFTAAVDGAPGGTQWGYSHVDRNLGFNVRWGVTNNLTLTGTVRPDFSQVETDANQLVFDPRQALFFPEKRPFFLEGLEQFNTPNNLAYTRRLIQPVAAIKLTGKVSGFGLGLLAGADDRAYSADGDHHPSFAIARVRRDLGGASTWGVVYTDKIDGDDYNRVAGSDARIVFGGIYTARGQVAGSFTRQAGQTFSAPLWSASLDRTGRTFGFTYSLNGVAPDFVAASGFISRPGIVVGQIDHRLTRYGRPGSAVETWTGDVLLFGRWRYPTFTSGSLPDDQEIHFNSTWQVRGWKLTSGLFIESFHYDPGLYADYALEHTAGAVTDTVPFVGTPRIANYDVLLQIETPQFRKFDGSFLFLPAIQDENFFEWSPARILIMQADLTWRPSDRLRVNVSYLHQQYWRRSDGSTVSRELIPRLKLEYQATRSVFFRVVGQYDAAWQDSLRDDSRTNDPILIRNPGTGIYERAVQQRSNAVRLDWLASFTPSPGTVMYMGYGSSLSEPQSFAFRGLRPLQDRFFAKVSYLFRM